jgi:hypothetical protein
MRLEMLFTNRLVQLVAGLIYLVICITALSPLFGW